jgi:hypothetical protein
MAHFAKIDENNIVVHVIVVADEHEADGENWCKDFLGGTWKQTSYNTHANVHALGGTPYRKNYAGGDFTYDATRDAFIPPKPFPSWTLVEDTCQWKAPIDRPDDAISPEEPKGELYDWDEDAYQADNSTGWVLTVPENLPETHSRFNRAMPL